jgi:hypothetical protein
VDLWHGGALSVAGYKRGPLRPVDAAVIVGFQVNEKVPGTRE